MQTMFGEKNIDFENKIPLVYMLRDQRQNYIFFSYVLGGGGG